LQKQYLKKYFSPWTDAFLLKKNSGSLEVEKEVIADFKRFPGWLENKQKNTTATINQLSRIMELNNFPNLKSHAITVHNTNLRQLPTSRPIFGNWHEAGQGFPFDNLQVSLIKANSPVFILQVSKNGAWDLVSTSENAIGWIYSQDLAYADNKFINAWKNSSHFIVAERDGDPLLDSNMHFYSESRIGELLPLVTTTSNHYWVKLAVRDINGDARIKLVRINKNVSGIFPLPATSSLIAQYINRMMNTPYGWGELYGYRDCSATTKDLFSVFGVWLPRNSSDQAQTGHLINLGGLTKKEKLKRIQSTAKPFFTLISLPGHIMLYLGEYHHQLWVFHSPWGLHTYNLLSGRKGRAIIGRSIITPLTLGEEYSNVSQSLIDRVTGMTILAYPDSRP